MNLFLFLPPPPHALFQHHMEQPTESPRGGLNPELFIYNMKKICTTWLIGRNVPSIIQEYMVPVHCKGINMKYIIDGGELGGGFERPHESIQSDMRQTGQHRPARSGEALRVPPLVSVLELPCSHFVRLGSPVRPTGRSKKVQV